MNLKNRIDALQRSVLGDGDPVQRVMSTMTAQELHELIEALDAERLRRGEEKLPPGSCDDMPPLEREELANWLQKALDSHRAEKAAGVAA